MEIFTLILILALAVRFAAAPAFLGFIRTLGAAFRVAAAFRRGQSKSSDVLQLAIRARLLVRPTVRPDHKPQFWMGVEYDAMPERRLLDICAAYHDLRVAGVPHDTTIERLEIWRSRFGTANLSQKHASLDDYLRYRVGTEFPGLEPWPPYLFAWQRRVFLRHIGIKGRRQRSRLDQLQGGLRRQLYTVRISGADVALDDGTQTIPIGWTDLEKYLESDAAAVRVLDGDAIWSYAASRSAGLALVRDGRIIDLSELAEFGRRPLRRQLDDWR